MMVVVAKCNTQQPRQRLPKRLLARRKLSVTARLTTTTIHRAGRGNPPKIHCRIGSGTCVRGWLRTSELGPKLARRSSNSISSSSSSNSLQNFRSMPTSLAANNFIDARIA